MFIGVNPFGHSDFSPSVHANWRANFIPGKGKNDQAEPVAAPRAGPGGPWPALKIPGPSTGPPYIFCKLQGFRSLKLKLYSYLHA